MYILSGLLLKLLYGTLRALRGLYFQHTRCAQSLTAPRVRKIVVSITPKRVREIFCELNCDIKDFSVISSPSDERQVSLVLSLCFLFFILKNSDNFRDKTRFETEAVVFSYSIIFVFHNKYTATAG